MKKSGLAFIVLFACAMHSAAQSYRTIPVSVLRDKIKGGWAGKMIGVTYGAPHEFRFQQAINTDSMKWKPADIKESIWQDDIYVQLTFLMAMDKYGIDAPAVRFQEMLAKAGYPLWCANMQARKNYFDHIYAPASGNPVNSYRADDIDFQIEADYIGFMNPAMPQNVVNIAGKIGHIMNYGDGVYGGIFLGAMYSAAYFENDIRKVIEAGLEAIPAQSDYARIVRDVIKLHEHYPGDWKAAWKELEAKWGSVDISAAGDPFNIDAKLNGAYIVMGLLYGEGDYMKTLEITTRCGQDADCNPSSAMAVLGLINGFSKLPADMQQGVEAVGDSLFINTTYSWNSAVEATYQYALKLAKRSGGGLQGDQLRIRTQPTVPAKMETSFPQVVFNKKFQITDTDWKWSGNWQAKKEKNADGTERTVAMYASVKGDAAELHFNGTGLSLNGNWLKDCGMADIYLDGKKMKTIDNYYDYSNQQHYDVSIWHALQLKPGDHTLQVVVLGKKDHASQAETIYLTGAVCFMTGPKKSDTYRFSFE